MESLKELKAIINNKPEGATHYLVNQYNFTEGYFKLDNFNCLCDYGVKGWVDIGNDISIDGNHCVRDVSDIERIIELTEILSLISDLSLLSGDEGIQHRVDSLLG